MTPTQIALTTDKITQAFLSNDIPQILSGKAERIETESGGIVSTIKATRTDRRVTLYITIEIEEQKSNGAT